MSFACSAIRTATVRAMPVDLGDRTVRVADDGGLPRVGLLANANVEWKRAEVLDVVFLGHALAAALAEDVLGVAALGTHVQRHVLDDAEDRDADLLEHLQALARVEQRDVLRRGDDHGAGDRDLLREREVDVAGSGRQVDDQVVEVAPVGVAQGAARAPG